MSKPIRVLVFGTTGVGKTSVCNALTLEKKDISSSAKGVTFESYTYKEVEIRAGKSLIITDTVGLNEGQRGTVKPEEAANALIKLLKNSGEGYNLLIHVFRIPRITKIEENNYQFFVKIIAESQIPTILVATGCEGEEPMSKWKSENQGTFNHMGMKYEDIICTCFASGGPPLLAQVYEVLRNESRQAVLNAIHTYAAPEPVKIYSSENGFIVLVKRSVNWVFNWLGLSQFRFELNKKLVEILIQMGCPKEVAIKLAEQI